MKKGLVIVSLMLLPFAAMFSATKANVQVTASLQSQAMTLTVNDIQMTGRAGGTPGNGNIEFGTVATLLDGKFATALETLQVNFNAANNMYLIQAYTANSNESYNVAKFKGVDEAGYWNAGSEANGMIGATIPDYVVPLLWNVKDANVNTQLSNATISSWTYYKDYYTTMGEGATGRLLTTSIIPGLSTFSNAAGVASAANRPYETWTKTWNQDFSKAASDPLHWKNGADAVGYRNFVYGTGGSGYTIVTGGISKSDATNNTVYLNTAATFEGKPAQSYDTGKVFVEIIAQ